MVLDLLPPIQEKTTENNGRFPQVWIRWFLDIYDIIDDLNSGGVTSVNGLTGVVVLDSDDIPEGSTNLYDKTVVLTAGANITVTGTYPNFTIAADLSSPPITTVTSNTTLDDTNYTVLCDATSGAITITLPAAASNSGRTYYIKKINTSSNDVTVDANGSETIDGDLTQTLTGADMPSIRIQCDGSNWFII